jgi:hypothetical protein
LDDFGSRVVRKAAGQVLSQVDIRAGAVLVGERKALPAGRMRLAEGHIPWPRRAPCWGGLQAADLGGPWGGEAVDRRARIGRHGRQRHPSTVATASRSSCPSAKAQSASSY